MRARKAENQKDYDDTWHEVNSDRRRYDYGWRGDGERPSDELIRLAREEQQRDDAIADSNYAACSAAAMEALRQQQRVQQREWQEKADAQAAASAAQYKVAEAAREAGYRRSMAGTQGSRATPSPGASSPARTAGHDDEGRLRYFGGVSDNAGHLHDAYGVYKSVAGIPDGATDLVSPTLDYVQQPTGNVTQLDGLPTVGADGVRRIGDRMTKMLDGSTTYAAPGVGVTGDGSAAASAAANAGRENQQLQSQLANTNRTLDLLRQQETQRRQAADLLRKVDAFTVRQPLSWTTGTDVTADTFDDILGTASAAPSLSAAKPNDLLDLLRDPGTAAPAGTAPPRAAKDEFDNLLDAK
jgi:hypothetical protein